MLFDVFQLFLLYLFKTGSSNLISTGKPPTGKLVATLKRPTNAIVQNITLPKSTKGRVVTLQLPAGQEREVRFREVEVYNGELLGKRAYRNSGGGWGGSLGNSSGCVPSRNGNETLTLFIVNMQDLIYLKIAKPFCSI